MALLEVIFVVGLLFEVGNCQEEIDLYSQPGKDVTLPCGSQNQPRQCSDVFWLYNRDLTGSPYEAEKGEINWRSPRADRMSLGINCSLAIKNVTAEDIGRFTCRQEGQQDFSVHLSLLSISPGPADFDPKRGDELSLECSLMRYRGLHSCRSNPLRWVDETGAVMTEGVEKSSNHSECLSYLKVKRQSGNNRTFTCQVLNNNKVEIQADYTPSFRDNRASTDSTGWSPLSSIMLALRISALVLMIVSSVLVFTLRGIIKPSSKVHEDVTEVDYENERYHTAASMELQQLPDQD